MESETKWNFEISNIAKDLKLKRLQNNDEHILLCSDENLFCDFDDKNNI